MELFIELLLKVIPLYLLIGLGIVAGRKAGVTKESISNLLVYFIEPAVVCYRLREVISKQHTYYFQLSRLQHALRLRWSCS